MYKSKINKKINMKQIVTNFSFSAITTTLIHLTILAFFVSSVKVCQDTHTHKHQRSTSPFTVLALVTDRRCPVLIRAATAADEGSESSLQPTNVPSLTHTQLIITEDGTRHHWLKMTHCVTLKNTNNG